MNYLIPLVDVVDRFRQPEWQEQLLGTTCSAFGRDNRPFHYRRSDAVGYTMRWAALVPELVVTDLVESLHVYTALFGFEVRFDRPGFVYLELGEAQIMLVEGGGDPNWRTGPLERPFGRGINLQIEVASVLPIRERLQAADYPVKVEIETNWYRQDEVLHGHREFLVMDPDGYLLRFAESIGERAAGK